MLPFAIIVLAALSIASGGSNVDPAGPLGAIRTLREIHAAEESYRQRFSRYGTLSEIKTISSSPYVRRAAEEEPFEFRFVLRGYAHGLRCHYRTSVRINPSQLLYGSDGSK